MGNTETDHDNLDAIDTILVPQGPEYRAICQGLGPLTVPQVVPVPIGPEPLRQRLQELAQTGYWTVGQRVLVMGLCGSLRSGYTVGDCVLYHSCVDGTRSTAEALECDHDLTTRLQAKLALPADPMRALTSDRLIWSAVEKQQLAQRWNANVVDMEGFPALAFLQQQGVAVAMLRAISDESQHDLPDLTAAIGPDGALKPLPLAIGMIRQPIAAARLIRGSLQGLRTLQAVTRTLFQPEA